MQFLESFQLLHRRAISEGDMPNMILSTGSISPSPCSESPEVLQITYPVLKSTPSVSGSVTPVFVSLEPALPSFSSYRRENNHLRQLNGKLAVDLADVTNDLSQTRDKLYTEMTTLARFQNQVARSVEHIQKLEIRLQRFAGLLVDIGIPYFTVQRISDALDSDPGKAGHMLVDAIGEVVHDPEALPSGLKPVVGQCEPERYQSALHRTLSLRRKARAQKKVSKFCKRLFQEDDPHLDTVTPSSSNSSSAYNLLGPARQDALITRRLEAKEASARHVFVGPPVQHGLPLSIPASGVSATTSVSGSVVQFQRPANSSLPPKVRPSISELHISRRCAVLGGIDHNVPQLYAEPADPEQDECEDHNARPMVTLSQDLIESLNHVALGRKYRSSATSISSVSSRPSTSASPSPSFSALVPTSTYDLIPDRPLDNSSFHDLLYGTHSAHVDSKARNYTNARTGTGMKSRFFEHINEYWTASLAIDSVDSMELTYSTGSLAVLDTMASIATSPATFDLSEESRDLDSLFMSTPTPTTGPTTPSKTPHTAITTPSSSGRKLPVLRHLDSPLRKGGVVRRVYPSPESFVRKLRMLGSGEGNASPEKPLGTPIM